MFTLLAAEASSPDFVATLLQWGPPGVIIVLLLTGMLVTKGAYEQMKTDRDRWEAAYSKEQDAHATTRDALADTSRSAAAAVETARTTTQILSSLGHSTARPGNGA